MNSFFRKVRQKLIEQNKIAKYLKYAVGEIILVVVGILIALYLNNLNEENNRQKEINQLLVDIENDLITDYDATNIVLEFLAFQDSIAKLIADNKLTEADYSASNKLNYFVTNWDYIIPNVKNLNQIVESEKIVANELKPIVTASKRLLVSGQVLNETWSNLKNNIDDNFKALSKFPWMVKYDSASTAQRLKYLLHDPEYQALALSYWAMTQNFYDKISRYRAQTITTLLTIKKYKEKYSDQELITMIQNMGMLPFKEYPCEIEKKDLISLKSRRSIEFFGNLTQDGLRFSLTNNKGQEIIDNVLVPPMSFESMYYSEFFGIDGDQNTLVSLVDKNGNCIKKYGAIENGYLIIKSHD